LKPYMILGEQNEAADELRSLGNRVTHTTVLTLFLRLLTSRVLVGMRSTCQ
jgi:hypothetical protein